MNNEFQFYMEIVRKRGMNKKVKEYKICRTSEVEAEKKETANPRRRNGPKVRMDGGCYTNQKSTRNRRRGAEPPAEPPADPPVEIRAISGYATDFRPPIENKHTIYGKVISKV
jgi:hypothetical protein